MRRSVLVTATVLGCIASVATGAAGYRQYLVSELRKPVLAQLSDPDSAVFKDEKYVGNWTVSGGYLCGRVNAKNKMGGYVGYRWFDGDATDAIIETEFVQEVFDKKGVDRCGDDLSKGAPWWWLTR